MKSNNSQPAAGLGSDLDASRIDLNKLRTFAAIAENGGVSAAAGHLSLSRSAVSHSLATLESALGVSLFHRVGKRMVLTRDGDLLRRAYEDAESRIGDALTAIGEAAVEVRGQLRLGLYPGFSRFRLAAVLDTFLGEYPDARCRLVHGSRRELLDAVLEGRLDFVLSLGPGEASSERRIAARPVFEQSLVLAHRKGLRKSGRGFDAVSRLPIVDYFRSEPLVDRWVAHHYHPARPNQRGRQAGLERIPRSNVRAWVGSGTDVALELTRSGVGACVLPADLVEPYRRDGELTIVKGPREVLRDEIWLHQLADARPNALRSAFREALL